MRVGPLRRVVDARAESGRAGNVVLELECGHRIVRRSKYHTPKRARCTACAAAEIQP